MHTKAKNLYERRFCSGEILRFAQDDKFGFRCTFCHSERSEESRIARFVSPDCYARNRSRMHHWAVKAIIYDPAKTLEVLIYLLKG
jgi:hypothetical protein